MVAAMSSGLPTSARLIFSRPDLTFGFSHSIGVSTAPSVFGRKVSMKPKEVLPPMSS
jgi:hypothetical protein